MVSVRPILNSPLYPIIVAMVPPANIPNPDPKSRAVKYVELAVPRREAGTRSTIIDCIAGPTNPNPRPIRTDVAMYVELLRNRMNSVLDMMIVTIPTSSNICCSFPLSNIPTPSRAAVIPIEKKRKKLAEE